MQNTHVFLANNPIPISMRMHHMPLDYVKIVSESILCTLSTRYFLYSASGIFPSIIFKPLIVLLPIWYAKHIGIKAVFFYLLLFFYSYFTIIL